MSEPQEHEDEYDDAFVAGLECMWGAGFLSPGGAEEVAAILESIDLTGKEVLDIGCGLGTIDILLAREHGAANVTGIDIELPLIDRARSVVSEAGLSDRIDVQLVAPGPLPFERERFDVVFTKDSIIHIPDKTVFYTEVLRVLRPGGSFVGSDWLRGGEGEYSEEMQAWLDIVGLTFAMENLEGSRRSLEAAGFVDVQLRDRNEWYRKIVKQELHNITGDNYARVVAATDEKAAANRVKSTSTKQIIVESGELRPTHFRGRKALEAG